MADPKPTHCTHCGAPLVTWLTNGTLVPHAAPWQCIGYLKEQLKAARDRGAVAEAKLRDLVRAQTDVLR